MKRNNKLIREQLDKTLTVLRPLLDIQIPQKGWIRAIRNAIGMSGRQLADRLGVTKQNASLIESREIAGTATIKTLRNTAEALDCIFVYGFIPKTSLEEIIRGQAKKVASTRLARASHTMSLEDQSLNTIENKTVLEDMTNELADELPKYLWDE
ncbi:MAG: mobile mystery protein A [Candidatus Celaenobacter antarcticus]|nr:mobile mystery protein A [Candidatus Celaenobacter antarcticus]